jgi:hypothetical protein
VADDEGVLRPIEGGAPPGVPVFGRRATSLDARKYRRFGIEVETDTDRWVEEFEAYLDPDAGAILNLMNSRTEWQQANATAVLLGSSLRDDDGVSFAWTPPVEPEYDDDGEAILYDPDGNVVEVPEGEPVPEDAEVRYLWHDDELLTAAEVAEASQAFDPLVDGSSRRRFQYLMDSAVHRVQLEALNGLAEWIVGEAAKRPPRRPTSSARGQSRTSRTSGANSRSGRR